MGSLWIKAFAIYVNVNVGHQVLIQVFNHCTLICCWGNHIQTTLQSPTEDQRCVLYFQEMLELQLPPGWCSVDWRAGGADTCQDVTHLYPRHDLWAICELLPHYLVLHISLFKQWLGGRSIKQTHHNTSGLCVFRDIHPTQTLQPTMYYTALSFNLFTTSGLKGGVDCLYLGFVEKKQKTNSFTVKVWSPDPVRKDPLAQSVLPDVTSGPEVVR